MESKGKRFAFVAIVLMLALGVGIYFYQRDPDPTTYPPGVTPVQKITADMKGQDVTVMGYAVKMTQGKGHHFYTFRDMIEPGSIKAIVFKAESDNQTVDAPLKKSLDTGSLVTLSGKVDIYKDELEIIVIKASE